MSKYLSTNQLTKINQWLTDIRNSPILLHPLQTVIQEFVHEEPPNIRDLEVPTYNFNKSYEKRTIGKWKSEYLATSSREHLRPDDYQVQIYCHRLGLSEAFRPELNTVLSLGSLPNAETNDLVTESRTVLKSEFLRVLQIRNSFYAEEQLYHALLGQRGLSPEVTIFYEMRQSECIYGCEKAQQAADYAQVYATKEKLSVDFAALFSALPYPEVAVDEEGSSLFPSVSSSPESSSGMVGSSTTMVSSAGKAGHLRKEVISEADFNSWKDRWVFHTPDRSRPGTAASRRQPLAI